MLKNNKYSYIIVAGLAILSIGLSFLLFTKQVILGVNLVKINLPFGFNHKVLFENSIIITPNKNAEFNSKTGALVIGVWELSKNEKNVTKTSSLFEFWNETEAKNIKAGKLPMTPGYPKLVGWNKDLFPKLNNVEIAEIETPNISNFVPKEIDILNVKHRSFIFLKGGRVYEIGYFIPTKWIYNLGYKIIMKSMSFD